MQFLQVALDRDENVFETLAAQHLAKILIDDTAGPHGFAIEDLEGFAKTKDLVQWLRQRPEVEGGMLRRRVVEGELLAEDRLATARHADDQVDRVLENPAVQDLVESVVAARQPLDQRRALERLPWRTSALVPSRSRTVETRVSGSRGLCMKAAAPDRIASSALSMADTARIWLVPLAANSPHNRKPAPPEIRRSMTTTPGDRSSKCSLACVASSAMATSQPSVRRKYSANFAAYASRSTSSTRGRGSPSDLGADEGIRSAERSWASNLWASAALAPVSIRALINRSCSTCARE